MRTRHLLQAGIVATLLFLMGVLPAHGLAPHSTAAPAYPVGVTAAGGPLVDLWDGLLALLSVEPLSAVGDPPSPPVELPGDGGTAFPNAEDASGTSSDDEERGAGMDPDG